MKGLFRGLLLLTIAGCGIQGGNGKMHTSLNTTEDIKTLIPVSVKEMSERATKMKQEVDRVAEELIAIKAGEHTFANTAQVLDDILHKLSSEAALIRLMMMVHPDENMRNVGQQLSGELQSYIIEKIFHNKEVYKAFKDYMEKSVPQEELNAEERYFIDETWKDFKRSFTRKGVDLTDKELARSKELTNRLIELSQVFERNIAEDIKKIEVPESALAGLEDSFIESLPRTERDGVVYRTLDTSGPVYLMVMGHCEVEDTRKKLWLAYVNRGYPKNEAVLKEVIAIRDERAGLHGYPSFSHMDIEDEMAETPEKVDAFLHDLQSKSAAKAEEELKRLLGDLPVGVTLTSEGKIKPWDVGYINKKYIKKHFDLDDREIAKYFPVDNTLNELLAIYEAFLGIRFSVVDAKGFWHEDVRLVKVTTDQGKLLGYLLLDLFPRDNKYTHACQITLLQGLKDKNGVISPGLGAVIANFPKATKDRPALLKRGDVKTFFHEFGHALHALLGTTQLSSLSGTNVKTDFVELPSQMLEEWMDDPDIMRQVSKHYETGEPLPDDIIEKIVGLKHFNAGYFIRRQSTFARTALDMYRAGADKDVNLIFKNAANVMQPYIMYHPENHFVSSFGHLMGYGSKYYSYMWALVYAYDLFDQIKKYGLLNPETGKRYVETILSKGGSRHPRELLIDFLGRQPSSNAFFTAMGFGAATDQPATDETVTPSHKMDPGVADSGAVHDEL